MSSCLNQSLEMYVVVYTGVRCQHVKCHGERRDICDSCRRSWTTCQRKLAPTSWINCVRWFCVLLNSCSHVLCPADFSWLVSEWSLIDGRLCLMSVRYLKPAVHWSVHSSQKPGRRLACTCRRLVVDLSWTNCVPVASIVHYSNQSKICPKTGFSTTIEKWPVGFILCMTLTLISLDLGQ